MRSVILLILLMIPVLSLKGQKVRYKDIFPELASMSNDEAKNLLKAYLIEDLDHPNANFRLALLYEQNYRQADALTQYEYALANAEQSKTRWFKSSKVVDDKEVYRNPEYYAPIFKSVDDKGKPFVEFARVATKIKNGHDSADLFLKKIPPIYKAFTQSVNFYDRAVRAFAKINSEYLTLDDLYLFYNKDMEQRMLGLRKDYDSARHYFDQYLALTSTYPIAHHQQKYHIKPIVTYRLDGLITRMNFLTPDVEFWDYGKWVDDTRKSIGAEIVSLRAKLDLNEQKLQESLNAINNSNGENVVPYKLDKQLVYNLNNYDKQSLVLALLEYKAFKQDWILKTKTLKPDTANMDRNAEIYSTLIYENRSADTLLEVARNRYQPDKARKHADFIQKHYGGTEGLQQYTAEEKKFVESTYTQYAGELRSAVSSLASPAVPAEEKEKFVRFGKYNVSLLVHVPTTEALEKGETVTLQNKRNSDGSIYLAGIFKPDKKINNVVTFVARVNPDGKAGWMQQMNIRLDSASTTPDGNSHPGPMVLTQEGCVIIVHSVSLTGARRANTFLYLNEKGEDKLRIKMKITDYPRQINFIERTNSFTVLFKGSDEQLNPKEEELLTLVGVNALGDVLWKREVRLAGDVKNMVLLQEGYMLVGNFISIRDDRGRELRSKSPAESSPFLMRLSDQGTMVSMVPLTGKQPAYIISVVKVNDNSIHLLGLPGTPETAEGKSLSGSSDVIHIMTNKFCQVVSSNW